MPTGIYKHKKRLPLSEETKRKISNSSKGRVAWNKGKKGIFSKEALRKIGLATLSRPNGNKGKYWSRELREKRSGENAQNWKGGITPINYKIRNSLEYKLWRKAVFERDNYTCVWCGAKFIKGITGRVYIQADHIKPFAQYPELRFAIDNGRTLCVPCHKTTDTYGVVKK
jgi:hypothetical protein